DPFMDADEAVTEPVATGGADAVVTNLELHVVRPVADGYVSMACFGVLQGVGQALLHDSIGREVHGARKRDGFAFYLEPDRKPSSADQFEEGIEVVKARLWRELDVLAVMHRAEEVTHLSQRPTACFLDVLERLPFFAERLRQPMADCPNLEHHHAHGMRDHVMQLTRDSGALLSDRDTSRRRALPLRPGRAFLRLFGLRGALVQREAGKPADQEHRRDDDQ